jgi:hypothetical protein
MITQLEVDMSNRKEHSPRCRLLPAVGLLSDTEGSQVQRVGSHADAIAAGLIPAGSAGSLRASSQPAVGVPGSGAAGFFYLHFWKNSPS